ncbi:MAG: hypothetical protein ACI85H_001705 [Paracoccaceae bacterium]
MAFNLFGNSLWVNWTYKNMIKLRTLNKIYVFALVLIGFIMSGLPAMSYEEPQYKVVKKTDTYEVRFYKQRAVAQVTFGEKLNGFRVLFDYISGANEGSTKVEMTIPVTQVAKIDMSEPATQSNADGKMVMQFFLPKQYNMETAPKPTDPRVRIVNLPKMYYAVITHSGFASNSNFETNYKKLEAALVKDGVTISGQPIKATYNGPFALPFFRRNEAMYPLDWN